jgi:hypothetical protein
MKTHPGLISQLDDVAVPAPCWTQEANDWLPDDIKRPKVDSVLIVSHVVAPDMSETCLSLGVQVSTRDLLLFAPLPSSVNPGCGQIDHGHFVDSACHSTLLPAGKTHSPLA